MAGDVGDIVLGFDTLGPYMVSTVYDPSLQVQLLLVLIYQEKNVR